MLWRIGRFEGEILPGDDSLARRASHLKRIRKHRARRARRVRGSAGTAARVHQPEDLGPGCEPDRGKP